MRIRATPQEPPIEQSHTPTSNIPIHTMSFGAGGCVLAGPPAAAMATSTLVVPIDARIRGLKLEMPEKFTGNRFPPIARWLTKMERYFRLMKYPTDIWVDVIATWATDAAQAWLDKALQDV